MSEVPPATPPSDSSRIELAPGVFAPTDALRVQYARSSGPGGQNVNKLNTRAELWIPLDAITGMWPTAINRLRRLAGKRLTRDGSIHLIAQTERSQERNREAILDRLRELIRQAMIEPKPRRPTKPSRAAKRRRVEAKRRRGEIKKTRGSRRKNRLKRVSVIRDRCAEIGRDGGGMIIAMTRPWQILDELIEPGKADDLM